MRFGEQLISTLADAMAMFLPVRKALFLLSRKNERYGLQRFYTSKEKRLSPVLAVNIVVQQFCFLELRTQ